MKNERRHLIIAYLLGALLLPLTGLAQPEWVLSLGISQRYPDSLYLTGFGVARANQKGVKGECLERASEIARRNLAEKVCVSLQSSVTSRVDDIGGRVSQYFSSATEATSRLEVEGVDTDRYYNENEDLAYCLAYIRRSFVINTYTRKVDQLRQKLSSLWAIGKRMTASEGRGQMLRHLSSCYQISQDLEQAQAILFALHPASFETFHKERRSTPDDIAFVARLDSLMSMVLLKPIAAIEDASQQIISLLRQQAGPSVPVVRLEHFTYQDTRTASQFSHYLFQLLVAHMTQDAGWKIELEGDPTPERLNDSPKIAVITGTYWEDPNGVKVLTSMHRIGRSGTMGAATVFIPNSVITKSGLKTKPDNLEFAAGDKRLFTDQEMLPRGLSLAVWTNQGSRNPVFFQGDTMRIFVRLNAQAFLRFVYHLADGRRTLLLDNYRLGASHVDKVFEIPEQFVCRPPFGAEVLQVFARTNEFDSVATVKEGGYVFLREDLKQFLAKTRGMMRIEQPVMQAEQRLTLTTMEGSRTK